MQQTYRHPIANFFVANIQELISKFFRSKHIGVNFQIFLQQTYRHPIPNFLVANMQESVSKFFRSKHIEVTRRQIWYTKYWISNSLKFMLFLLDVGVLPYFTTVVSSMLVSILPNSTTVDFSKSLNYIQLRIWTFVQRSCSALPSHCLPY